MIATGGGLERCYASQNAASSIPKRLHQRIHQSRLGLCACDSHRLQRFCLIHVIASIQAKPLLRKQPGRRKPSLQGSCKLFTGLELNAQLMSNTRVLESGGGRGETPAIAPTINRGGRRRGLGVLEGGRQPRTHHESDHSGEYKVLAQRPENSLLVFWEK